MESIVVFAIIVLLVLVLGAISGLVAWSRTGELRARVAKLETELTTLRQRVAEDDRAPRQQTPATDASDVAGEKAPTHARPAAPDQTETGAPADTPRPSGASVPPVRTKIAATATAGDATVSMPSTMPPTMQDKPQRPFEERFGANWTVWIGGIALVLGGVFLVRYSIEAGLLTPLARVIAGALMALALIGAGEWARRRSPDEADNILGNAYIPGVLTLAGITTAFASVFAAHALYGLIGPTTAFVLLGSVALLTLAASVLHGPTVASYGLVACYGVPFLVSSAEPAVLPLAFYGLFVTLATYGVARIRRWRWLAIAGAAGAVFWAHVLAFASGRTDLGILALYDLATLALAAVVFVLSLYPRDAKAVPRTPDWLATGILAAHALPVFYLLQIDDFGALSVTTLVIVVVALLVLASEWPAVAGAALSAVVLGALSYLSWDVPLSPEIFVAGRTADPRILDALLNPEIVSFLRFGTGFAALYLAAGIVGTLRSTARWSLAAASTATPLALFAVAYFRTDALDVATLFGFLALAMAAGFAGLTAFFETRLTREAAHRELAVAAYAIATIAALVSGMAILLQEGWLVIGLALLTSGIAWIEIQKPLPVLRWLAVAVAALCCLAVLDDPSIAGAALSRTPVFNWLLVGYGVPALAFGATAWLMGFRARNLPQQIFEALTIVFALLTVGLLTHHAMNDGNLYAQADTLAERSLYTLLALAAALGLQHLHGKTGGKVFDQGAIILGALGMASIALIHFVFYNPYLTGELIGTNALFNLLIPGYLLPAILTGALAALSRGKRPKAYVMAAGLLALALLFAWINLEIRALFHRPRLDFGPVQDFELYTYSAAWLVLGIALLLLSVVNGSRTIRLASGALVALAVVKVFLIDMNSLTGIWRALSFIGLGVVLIGIGALYQRLIIGHKQTAGSEPNTTS